MKSLEIIWIVPHSSYITGLLENEELRISDLEKTKRLRNGGYYKMRNFVIYQCTEVNIVKFRL
jgi:hypothetical protein